MDLQLSLVPVDVARAGGCSFGGVDDVGVSEWGRGRGFGHRQRVQLRDPPVEEPVVQRRTLLNEAFVQCGHLHDLCVDLLGEVIAG